MEGDSHKMKRTCVLKAQFPLNTCTGLVYRETPVVLNHVINTIGTLLKELALLYCTCTSLFNINLPYEIGIIPFMGEEEVFER